MIQKLIPIMMRFHREKDDFVGMCLCHKQTKSPINTTSTRPSNGLNWEQNLYLQLGVPFLHTHAHLSFSLLTLNHTSGERFKSTLKIYRRKRGLLYKHHLTAIFFLSSEGSRWRLTFPLCVRVYIKCKKSVWDVLLV